MAARDHRVSRRALLGAAVAAPAFLRHPELGSGSISPPHERLSRWTLNQVQGDERPAPFPAERWNRALARFRRAEAALAAAAHEPDDDRFDAINTRFNAALRHIVRTPAPDLAALSAKIDLAVDQDIATLTGGERCLAVLKQDARRLAALPRSS